MIGDRFAAWLRRRLVDREGRRHRRALAALARVGGKVR